MGVCGAVLSPHKGLESSVGGTGDVLTRFSVRRLRAGRWMGRSVNRTPPSGTTKWRRPVFDNTKMAAP